MRQLFLLFFLISFSLSAEIITQQSFEAGSTDIWAYTANPSDMSRIVWWGRNDQPLGGASPQSGTWYWSSWNLQNSECSITFPAVSLPFGYIHSLSFFYFTNGLVSPAEYSRYCVEYDSGTEWTDWITLNPDTDAWTQVILDIPAYATTVRLKVIVKDNGTGKYAHWDNFVISNTPAPPTAPLVYNASVAQRTDGSGLVDIHYDLFDANGDASTISLLLSEDGGANYNLTPSPANLSGDLGEGIAYGTGKHIVWNAGVEAVPFDNNQYKLRILAEDNTVPPVPESFVLVPEGTYIMGRTTGSGEADELPTHAVNISSFVISKYEVTQSEWQSTMGYNPAAGYGVGNNHPVYSVSWYAVLKYCNLRSIADGFEPVYYISGSSNPTSWGTVPTSDNASWNSVICVWTANGYRLPTEAEWEYAARGGSSAPDYQYSGSNDISEVSWYSSNSNTASHAVGTKLSNSLGIFDMSGNIWEWCWDWYGAYDSVTQSNPTGASVGSYRIIRGGNWYYDATYCRIADRDHDGPFDNALLAGFRVCRSLDNFVLIEGGTFNNGTSDVTLSSFYIDKFELTQSGYKAIVGSNPASGFGIGDMFPVYNLNWGDFIGYCNLRSIQEGYTPCYSYDNYGTNPLNWPIGWSTNSSNYINVSCNWTANGYRLPTEMEWMFAAMGGNQSQGYIYSGSNDINAVAWYDDIYGSYSHIVGALVANELGLFDMSGNVWEWCWDIWGDYYLSGNQNNPTGPLSGTNRVLRGGCWSNPAISCMLSHRGFSSPSDTNYHYGFRLVRSFP